MRTQDYDQWRRGGLKVNPNYKGAVAANIFSDGYKGIKISFLVHFEFVENQQM